MKTFATFNVDEAAEVDRLTSIAVAKGAVLRKAPFTTYYGWYQSVLLDPEGNAFRIILAPYSARPFERNWFSADFTGWRH